MIGTCPNCGTTVWAGSRPKMTELVVCPHCFADCSEPLTPQDRAADYKRRVYKRMAAYGEDFETAAANTVYETEREREYPLKVARMKEQRAKETSNA